MKQHKKSVHTPDNPLMVPSTVVLKAIKSFPSGSAGGHDSLLPQHLKDLISPPSQTEFSIHSVFITVQFVNMVISGNVPLVARPFIFGANLIGLDDFHNNIMNY